MPIDNIEAVRQLEEANRRIAVLEGDIREYERSMENANEEIRALKENWRIAMDRQRDLEETVRVEVRVLEKKLAAAEREPVWRLGPRLRALLEVRRDPGETIVDALHRIIREREDFARENREKCLELAEKAGEIRELRGVVDAAAAFVAWVDQFYVTPTTASEQFDELRKRLAALDLPDDAPRTEPEPPTLPRPILDLMAALNASLEVYDPHGLKAMEFSAPGGFTAMNFGIRAGGHSVEVLAGTIVAGREMGQTVPLPPAAAEGAASVNVRREVVIGAEAARLAFEPCKHVMGASCLVGQIGAPPGVPHCVTCERCGERIPWDDWPEADRERYLAL